MLEPFEELFMKSEVGIFKLEFQLFETETSGAGTVSDAEHSSAFEIFHVF
jgi:hypothetical protein